MWTLSTGSELTRRFPQYLLKTLFGTTGTLRRNDRHESVEPLGTVSRPDKYCGIQRVSSPRFRSILAGVGKLLGVSLNWKGTRLT